MSSNSNKYEVFKHFYSKIVEILPMNDGLFMAELFSDDLLPGDVKKYIHAQATSAEKAVLFLDCIIKPSVTSDSDGDNSFDKLLNIMEDCEYQHVEELAKQIRASFGTTSISKRSQRATSTNKGLYIVIISL